jgi:hypothetical protein
VLSPRRSSRENKSCAVSSQPCSCFSPPRRRTPPHFGEDARKSVPNSVHVIVPGAHVSDSPCIAEMMKRFLADADPKHLDTSCAAKSKLPPFALK